MDGAPSLRFRPHRSVKTTRGVDSHFGPPAIHGTAHAHPPPAQRPAAMRPARPLPDGPHGPWREQPPSPKARCGVAASVFSHPRHRLRGCSRTRDPLREGHARRHERLGLTRAATSDSEPERPMGTADPARHGNHGECVVHPGDSLESANLVGKRGTVRGRGGGAPRQPRRGHAECGPSEYAAEPP